ncbi:MAG: hypothetical protein R3D51_03275 [Hyphomicrobiaceae bacterium]
MSKIRHTTIDTDAFDALFRPVPNHMDSNASVDFGRGGCLFETYGEALAFVRSQNPQCIWTIIDGDDGESLIVSGYHFVNRLGYILTARPVPADARYTVRNFDD